MPKRSCVAMGQVSLTRLDQEGRSPGDGSYSTATTRREP